MKNEKGLEARHKSASGEAPRKNISASGEAPRY